MECRYLKLQNQEDAAIAAAADNMARYSSVGGDIRASLSSKTAQFAQTVRRCVGGREQQALICVHADLHTSEQFVCGQEGWYIGEAASKLSQPLGVQLCHYWAAAHECH
jgi:hypothetical protein